MGQQKKYLNSTAPLKKSALQQPLTAHKGKSVTQLQTAVNPGPHLHFFALSDKEVELT